jgi:hypothetical protein
MNELRDKIICDYYLAGNKLSVCASHFKLGRQRTLQILQEGGVWKPYKKKPSAFLGVNIAADTKDAVVEEAKRLGISTSKLTDDILGDAMGLGVER